MECPICSHRLSEWEVRHDKTSVVGGTLVHKSCLIDHKLRTGEDYSLKPKCAKCEKKIAGCALVSWRGKRFHMDCFIELLKEQR